jgi:hypothetical protein
LLLVYPDSFGDWINQAANRVNHGHDAAAVIIRLYPRICPHAPLLGHAGKSLAARDARVRPDHVEVR